MIYLCCHSDPSPAISLHGPCPGGGPQHGPRALLKKSCHWWPAFGAPLLNRLIASYLFKDQLSPELIPKTLSSFQSLSGWSSHPRPSTQSPPLRPQPIVPILRITLPPLYLSCSNFLWVSSSEEPYETHLQVCPETSRAWELNRGRFNRGETMRGEGVKRWGAN